MLDRDYLGYIYHKGCDNASISP